MNKDSRDFHRTDFWWHWRRGLVQPLLQLATNRLLDWIARARQSALHPFDAFCRLLEKHRAGVPRYLLHPVGAGLSKAINSPMNVLNVRAHGHKHLDYLVHKIHQRYRAI